MIDNQLPTAWSYHKISNIISWYYVSYIALWSSLHLIFQIIEWSQESIVDSWRLLHTQPGPLCWHTVGHRSWLLQSENTMMMVIVFSFVLEIWSQGYRCYWPAQILGRTQWDAPSGKIIWVVLFDCDLAMMIILMMVMMAVPPSWERCHYPPRNYLFQRFLRHKSDPRR